tara:strand:+ start:53 stop:379 length:327 start_codon:yes stop_codon:yes gene_type:complete
MAFKMRGFPMQDTSALKNYNKMSDYSSKSVKFGEDEKDPAFKQKEGKKKVNMDEVYKILDEKMGHTEGFSAKEIAAMSEKEREGNIDGYEIGDFDRMVAEAKKQLEGK